MTNELHQRVLDILTENIRPSSSEAAEYKAYLPTEAVNNSTPRSLRAFIEIHEALAELATRDNYRTRHAGRTSTEGIGISFYTHLGRGIEIQSILLPTRSNWYGCIEAYLRGHDRSPLTAPTLHNARVGDEMRDGRPVFRVIGRPSRRFVTQLIDCFGRSSLFFNPSNRSSSNLRPSS